MKTFKFHAKITSPFDSTLNIKFEIECEEADEIWAEMTARDILRALGYPDHAIFRILEKTKEENNVEKNTLYSGGRGHD